MIIHSSLLNRANRSSQRKSSRCRMAAKLSKASHHACTFASGSLSRIAGFFLIGGH